MPNYVIGDIHGCYTALRELLDKIDFRVKEDTIWLVGDLVNRGGDSVLVLDFLYSIRDSIKLVLGNHDLHLLALLSGNNKVLANSELNKVIEHPKANKWFDWLRSCPLAIEDKENSILMVHAGIPHIWTIEKALSFANEVSEELSGNNPNNLLRDIYGNKPNKWDYSLEGVDRLRCIINYFTRMRFITDDGTLDLHSSSNASEAPYGTKPWFYYSREDYSGTILFGHWASLKGNAANTSIKVLAADSGYVWGGKLSAYNIDSLTKSWHVQNKEKHI